MASEAKQLILTAQPSAAVIALNEIQKAAPGARPAAFLSPEARLVALPEGYLSLLENLRETRLIFARHMFPVQYSAMVGGGTGAASLGDRPVGGDSLGGGAVGDTPMMGNAPASDSPAGDAADFNRPAFEAFLPKPGGEWDGLPFAVHIRIHSAAAGADLSAQAAELARTAEECLINRGFVKNDKEPTWAVSMFIRRDTDGVTLYAGVSYCQDNRSAWNGGEMRFKKDEDFISRSEFKLLEAFSVFGLPASPKDIAGTGLRVESAMTQAASFSRTQSAPEANSFAPLRALDLGAAPGGWTHALLNMGYQVTAIDPAALDSRLAVHPRLTHIQSVAQRFNGKKEDYRLIVNDMRMDTLDSVRIMLDMAPFLCAGGQAIMTLKLSQNHWYKQTAKALALLEQRYRIADVRQLFHNRGEVTVYAVLKS